MSPRPTDQPFESGNEADLQEQSQPVVDEEPARRPERVPLEANDADVLEQSIEEPLDEEDEI